ncbi:MAG TPA: UDP-2,3-diacylglucosamine diphosphatase [Bdellovibrionota bacterium]|jgi:UDP-2,3-diacylglucosamine pyrophosphatase LpxH
MITQVSCRKMVVFSDLHLGNPFSQVRRKTVRFIRWAVSQGYDICINGDGFDVAQVSLGRFTQDVPEVLQALKEAVRCGSSVYYVVGNHDIVFEHFLFDWSGFKLAPFLNVRCGGARFRVEHGHLYDPFFVASPRLYDLSTWVGGLLLKVNPALYRMWIRFERLKSRWLNIDGMPGIEGEPASFYCSAAKIEARGFDGVVFGHTHHSGSALLPLGGTYLNPGSWMLSSNFVRIEDGRAELLDFGSFEAAGGQQLVG